MDFVRLWLHEGARVYGDKLVEEKDVENLQRLKMETVKATFEVHIRSVQYMLHTDTSPQMAAAGVC